MATLASVTWTWHASTVILSELELNNPNHWQTAPGTVASNDPNVFTPSSSAVGRYLRVTATYTDPAVTDDDDGGDDGDTARLMAVYAVQAAEGGFGNGSPDFVDDSVELSVAENVAVGAKRGHGQGLDGRDPCDRQADLQPARFHGPADEATTGLTAPAGHVAAADAAAFSIDQRTGQITVAQSLDFESRGTPDDGKYIVVVRAVDPSGLFDIIGVVITASDVNDNPVLTGQAELTILENEDEEFDNPNNITGINVYEVTDEDDRAGVRSWDLEGEDADLLQLIDTGGRTLVFKSTDGPNFENPADADGDNVYKVTVVVLDGQGGRGEFDVCIEVRNENEDGEITLVDDSGNEVEQPYAHSRITAVLTDPDGGVNVTGWQWAMSDVNPAQADDLTNIEMATSANYRPLNADEGKFLQVTATYTDLFSADDTGTNAIDVLTTYAVLRGGAEGQAPVFTVDGTVDGLEVPGVEVSVAEGSPDGRLRGRAAPRGRRPG